MAAGESLAVGKVIEKGPYGTFDLHRGFVRESKGGNTMYHELRKEILRIILSTSDGEMHQLCYDALMRMREAESTPQLASNQAVG